MSEEVKEKIIITKGEKAVFSVYLMSNGRPFDLTSFDEFKICIDGDADVIEVSQTANAAGSVVEKVSPDVLGHLKVTLFPVDTLNLREGFGQDADIEIDNSSSPAPKRRRLHKALNVQGSLCG